MGYTEVKISGWVEDNFKIRKGSDAYGLLFYLALCFFIRHNTFIDGNCLILCRV